VFHGDDDLDNNNNITIRNNKVRGEKNELKDVTMIDKEEGEVRYRMKTLFWPRD
jgi:hypothetical protein